MADQQNNKSLVETIIMFVSGGALTGALAWLFKYLTFKQQVRQEEESRVDQNVRTAMDYYRKIIDEKDSDHNKERERWKTERDELIRENSNIRRANQNLLVDRESLRARVREQDQEIDSYTTTRGIDRKFVGDRFDPVFVVDAKGVVRWANESTSVFYGFPIAKILSMSSQDLLKTVGSESILAEINKVTSRFEPTKGNIVEKVIRCRAIQSDGAQVPVDCIMSAIPMDSVYAFRLQLRRRYDDFDATSDPSYIPTGASASGIMSGPVVLSAETPAVIAQREIKK